MKNGLLKHLMKFLKSTSVAIVIFFSINLMMLYGSEWYDQFGPDGKDSVVRIGNMYVAKGKINPGTSHNIMMDWSSAVNWADNLDWLGKTDWRIPNKEELVLIEKNSNDIGSYALNNYWSNTIDNEWGIERAWIVHFSADQVIPSFKTVTFHVRVVRDVE